KGRAPCGDDCDDPIDDSLKSKQEVLDLLLVNSSYNARISPDYELVGRSGNRELEICPRLRTFFTGATWEKPTGFNAACNHATKVAVQIHVLSIDSINEQSMDYSLNIYLRQRWVDPRLQFINHSHSEWLELDTKIMRKVWVPDTFFRNEKQGAFHDVTVPNRLMHLYRNGTIYYSMRLSVTLSCHMGLQKYPLDSQLCPILIASYGYTMENIIYEWMSSKPIDFNDQMELPQYTIQGVLLSDCTKTYKESEYGHVTSPLATCKSYRSGAEHQATLACIPDGTPAGSFSCVRADFQLQRDVGYYVIQVYVPSVLIVILSWVSFWLDVEAIPARISLGVLTVLTMTTQSTGARSQLPRVSYVKAIDVWMSTCLFFVFASLLEFAYINVLARRRFPYNCLGGSAHLNGTDEGMALQGKEDGISSPPTGPSRMYGKAGARFVDRVSRYLFPALFLGFNVGYWLIYTFVDL
ncbi:hypothetical protein BaRGS_00008161, partial [Batillaria attramentaria]